MLMYSALRFVFQRDGNVKGTSRILATRAYGWHTEVRHHPDFSGGHGMASIWLDPRTDNYLIKFHFGGKRFTRSCQTQKEGAAKLLKARR